jgi:hypothetical protein
LVFLEKAFESEIITLLKIPTDLGQKKRMTPKELCETSGTRI